MTRFVCVALMALMAAACGRDDARAPDQVVRDLCIAVEARDVAALEAYAPSGARSDDRLVKLRSDLIHQVINHFAGSRTFAPVAYYVDEPYAVVVTREIDEGGGAYEIFFPIYLLREGGQWHVMSKVLRYQFQSVFVEQVAIDPGAFMRVEHWYARYRTDVIGGKISVE